MALSIRDQLAANPLFGRRRGGTSRPFGILGNVPGQQTQFTAQRPVSASDRLTSEFQQAVDAATAANTARRDQILGGFDDLAAQQNTLLDQLGQQGAADVERRFQGISTQAGQNLVTSGLSGSTIAPQIQAGIGRQAAEAEASRAAGIAQQRLGVTTQNRMARLGFLERIEEEFPNQAQFLQQQQQFGEFGGAAQPQGIQFAPNPIQPRGGIAGRVQRRRAGSSAQSPQSSGIRFLQRPSVGGRPDPRKARTSPGFRSPPSRPDPRTARTSPGFRSGPSAGRGTGSITFEGRTMTLAEFRKLQAAQSQFIFGPQGTRIFG